MLKFLRDQAELSNEQAAKKAGFSTAKLSRLETGHNVVAVADIRKLLGIYKPGDELRRKVLDLAINADAPGWWEQFDDLFPDDFDLYLSVEEAAAALSLFQTSVVPGLFQTPEYARAWLRAEDPGLPNADLERYVEVRMTRQRVLSRQPDPLVVWAILDEAALRRAVGGADVMKRQLDHLLTSSEQSNITIQVLPFSAGAHVAASGSFTLVEFAEPTDPEVAYVDCAAGNVYPETPARIRTLKTSFHHLTSTALTAQRSLEFIRKIQKEFA